MHDGQEFERDGHRFRVNFRDDDDTTAPWKREDGHGPVSEWRRHAFGMGSKPPKAPGEMILCWDHGSYLTYDFAAAVRQAKAEGWDAPPYGEGTRGQRAHRAAMADFNRLREWCAGRWAYVVIEVTLLDDFGDDMDESGSVWGVESDADEYFAEIANELADEIIHRLAAQMRAA